MMSQPIDIFADNNIKNNDSLNSSPIDIFQDNNLNPTAMSASNKLLLSATQQLTNKMPDNYNYPISSFSQSPHYNTGDMYQNILNATPQAAAMRVLSDQPNRLKDLGVNTLKGIGTALTFFNPELMESPGLLSGLVNTAGRMGTGTAAMTAQDAKYIHSPGDLLESLKNNLIKSALFEAPVAATRAIGGVAEAFNPEKYVDYQANNIKKGFDQVSQLRKDTYAPVNQKYDDLKITSTPNSHFGFTKNETKYFTPNVKKSYDTFVDNPTFKNASDLRTQLGTDASKVSADSSQLNKYQSLNNARQKVVDKQRQLLSLDAPMLQQFDKGQEISRDLYYPYLSSSLLEDISKGNMTNVTGKKLTKDINYLSAGENHSIPKNHPLIKINEAIKNKISRGEALQELPSLGSAALGTMVGGGLGLTHGLQTGLEGGLLGGYLLHNTLPNAIKFSQNPYVSRLFSNLQPAYYGIARNSLPNV